MFGDPRQRFDEIDGAGQQCAARHPVVFGFVGILHDREPTTRPDRREARRSVGPGTSEHDTDRVAVVRVGQGVEEVVDRVPAAPVVLEFGQPQVRVDRRKIAARWDHVDVIGEQRDGLGHLSDRHRAVGLEQIGQMALVIGGEVDHHDEAQPGVGRDPLEQIAQHAQPAGARAHAHDCDRVGISGGGHRVQSSTGTDD